MSEQAVNAIKVATNTSNAYLIGVLALGALALVVFTVVYLKKGEISAVYGRVFALIVIAVLGVALGLSNASGTDQTAGFTLLGTVAGYLAGVKTQVAVKRRRPDAAEITRATAEGREPLGETDTTTYF
jgi:hypothetical protein